MLYPGKKSRARTLKRTKPRGFTLIELMVTLAVGAIVLAFAFPAFDDFVRNNRRAAAVNEFMAAANLARAEALRRSSRVTLCRSIDIHNDPLDPDPDCDVSGDGGGWEHGWFSFSDLNNDNLFDRDGVDNSLNTDDDEIILSVNQGLSDNFRLRGNNNLEQRLSFAPSGEAAGATNGTLSFCDTQDNGKNARNVVVAMTGRVRTEKDTYTSCPPP